MLQKVAIQASENATLSREQKSFNKLLKDNELLKNEIEKTKRQVEASDQLFNKHIQPIHVEIFETLLAILVKLDFALDNFKFSKKQTEILLQSMDGYFNFITTFPQSHENQVLTELIEKYSDPEDEISNEEQEELKDLFEAQFGVKIPEGFQFNPNDPDFERKVSEMLGGEMDDKSKTSIPKKSKKQQEAEEAMNKPLRQIYTSLVKMLHPDSEQDEELKLKKTEVMKEVTEAYEKADLFKLLSLQMEHGLLGNNKLTTVDASILKIYIKILKQKKEELNEEYRSFLYQKFADSFIISEKEALHRKKTLRASIDNDRKLIDLLSTEKGVKEYIRFL